MDAICVGRRVPRERRLPGARHRSGTAHKAPNYPPTQQEHDVSDWVEAVSEDPWKAKSFPVTHFGQLGDLTNGKGGKPAHFERLIKQTKASADEKKLLFASYRLLTMTIRNRDAHAYVPNVRDSHFWMVQDVFMPALVAAHVKTRKSEPRSAYGGRSFRSSVFRHTR
jgi:hypothetical protein